MAKPVKSTVFTGAGQKLGLEIWRIENFEAHKLPEDGSWLAPEYSSLVILLFLSLHEELCSVTYFFHRFSLLEYGKFASGDSYLVLHTKGFVSKSRVGNFQHGTPFRLEKIDRHENLTQQIITFLCISMLDEVQFTPTHLRIFS
jgi:hypothetical protein